jgi:hypothetical protein
MTINIYLRNDLWNFYVAQNISSYRTWNHVAFRTAITVLNCNKCDKLWKIRVQVIPSLLSSWQMAFYTLCSDDVIKFIYALCLNYTKIQLNITQNKTGSLTQNIEI